MALVPVTVHIEVPDGAIPAPPAPSASIVRAFGSSRHGLKSTGSLAFEPCGVKQAVTVASACRIRVQVTGIFGHTTAGGFVNAGIACNGVMLEDDAVLAAARVPSVLDVINFAIDFTHPQQSAGDYEYELYLRQTDQTSGAAGYLGRRGQDTAPSVKTTISLTVLDPL